MDKKKALLILVGGRACIPNILTVIHQRPDVVTAIISKDSNPEFLQFRKAANIISPSCIVEEMAPVDAFCKEEIEARCEEALKLHTDMIWVFNVTAATSIMSISAYEVAKRYQHTCWYLDTNNARVIALVGDTGDKSIFKIDVSQYVTAYGRELSSGDLEDRRQQSEENWLPFAQKLGKNPHYADILKRVMLKVGTDKRGRPSKAKAKEYLLKQSSAETYHVLEAAKQVDLLEELSRDDGSNIRFRLSYLQDKFLNGSWLEAYTWDEAKKIWNEAEGKPLFDDCQWNRKIVTGKSGNELDVAMTYLAQMMIIECKTGEDESFASDTLYKLDSVANVLGGKFVVRILATSLLSKKPSTEFLAQAESRRIIVVTGEDLPNIGEIIEREAKRPTYPRI